MILLPNILPVVDLHSLPYHPELSHTFIHPHQKPVQSSSAQAHPTWSSFPKKTAEERSNASNTSSPDFLKHEYMIPVVDHHERLSVDVDAPKGSSSPPGESSSANTTVTTTTPVSGNNSPPSDHGANISSEERASRSTNAPPPFPHPAHDPYKSASATPSHFSPRYNPFLSTQLTSHSAFPPSPSRHHVEEQEQQNFQSPYSSKYNPLEYSCALKLLVSNNVAGSIIGRSGQTISELQTQSNTRIKLSQAGDFYPGTQDRVCLIQGDDPAHIKLAIRLLVIRLYRLQEQHHTQHLAWQMQKQPGMEPPSFEFVLRILIPVASGGMVIGKGGSNIKYLQETTGVVVRLSPKDTVEQSYPPIVNNTSERVVTITGIGMQGCLECLYLIFDEMTSHPEMARYSNMTTSYNRLVQEPVTFLATSVRASGAVLLSSPPTPSSPRMEAAPLWQSQQSEMFMPQPESYRRIQSFPDLTGAQLHDSFSADPDFFSEATATSPMYLMAQSDHRPLHTSVSAPDLLASQLEQTHLDHHHRPSAASTPGTFAPPPARVGPSLEPQTPMMTHPGCFEASVQIPDSMIGSVLGRAGRTLNELQLLSNTRIKISQRGEYVPGTQNRWVTIRGPTSDCVWQAQFLMSQRMVLPTTAAVPSEYDEAVAPPL